MLYVLAGLNIASHLALIGLLIFLCFRTKSKGLILISATLLVYQIFHLIFEQVVESDWWRWKPDKIMNEGMLGMTDVDLLLTIALATPLVYRCLCVLGVFLIYKEWRQGKFNYPPT